jgi:hypothetical protein
VEFRQYVVAEAQPLHRAGLEVLHHRVVVGYQALDECHTLWALEVDPDARFPEVVPQVRSADLVSVVVEDLRGRAAPGLALGRVLDLHHLGAEVGEKLSRIGHGLHLLDGEDAHIGEGKRVGCVQGGLRVGAHRSHKGSIRAGSKALSHPESAPEDPHAAACDPLVPRDVWGGSTTRWTSRW